MPLVVILAVVVTWYTTYSIAQKKHEKEILKMSNEYLWNLNAITLTNLSRVMRQTEIIKNNKINEFNVTSCEYLDSFIMRVADTKYGKSDSAVTEIKKIQKYIAKMKTSNECN